MYKKKLLQWGKTAGISPDSVVTTNGRQTSDRPGQRPTPLPWLPGPDSSPPARTIPAGTDPPPDDRSMDRLAVRSVRMQIHRQSRRNRVSALQQRSTRTCCSKATKTLYQVAHLGPASHTQTHNGAAQFLLHGTIRLVDEAARERQGSKGARGLQKQGKAG